MLKLNTTKKAFCDAQPECKRLRKTDPIQFNVLYNDWVRETTEKHIKIKRTLLFLDGLRMAQLGLRY